MRAWTLATLICLSVAVPARADVRAMPPECPAGQSIQSVPGCPGHGVHARCGWSRCTDDEQCGTSNRCSDRSVCFRMAELQCWRGDPRAGPETGEHYTTSQRQRGDACGADDACPEGATCEHFRECEPAPEPPRQEAPEEPPREARAPDQPAPAEPEGPGFCGVSARGDAGPAWLVGLLVAVWATRRARAS